LEEELTITRKNSGKSPKKHISKEKTGFLKPYLLLLTLTSFFVPILTIGSLKDPFDSPKLILLFFVVPFFWFFYFLQENKLEFGMAEILLLCFTTLVYLSGIFNYFTSEGYQLKFLFGNLRQSLSPTVLMVGAFYFLAFKQVKEKESLELSFVLGLLTLSLATHYQFFRLDETATFQGRTFVSAGNPVYLGAMLSLGAVFLLYARKINPTLKWITFVFTLAALITTQSRVAILAFVLGAIVYALAANNAGAKWAGIAGAFLSAVLFFVLGSHRISSLVSDFKVRFDLYRAAFRSLTEKPLTGRGYTSFENYFRKLPLSRNYLNRLGEIPDSSHSALLDFAYSFGLVATLFLLGFLVVFIFQLPAFGVASVMILLFSPVTVSVWVFLLTAAGIISGERSSALIKVEISKRLRFVLSVVLIVFALLGIFSGFKLAAAGYYSRLSFEKMHEGKLIEALELLEKASGYLPQEPEFLLEKARILARTAVFNDEATVQKMFEEADETLAQVLQIDPFNYEAYILRADILSLISSSSAVEAARIAIYLSPYDAEGYYYLGLAEAAQDDLQGAIESWEKAIKLKKDYAEAYFSLGYAYEILKDYKKAANYYQLALKYAALEDRKNIELRLKELKNKSTNNRMQ
jgi:tetratricopeptide (TPR) repeat protein